MATTDATTCQVLCARRLMRDVQELVDEPYTNIAYHVHGDDMTQGCLVLSPEGQPKRHITVQLGPRYPLEPPRMRMDSRLIHPNVYGGFICATILRATDEYTPAYTLKAIAIQMLSFLCSEYVEQEHGGAFIRLADYQAMNKDRLKLYGDDDFACSHCRFDSKSLQPRSYVPGATFVVPHHQDPHRSRRRQRGGNVSSKEHTMVDNVAVTPLTISKTQVDSLPDELLLEILVNIPAFEDLTALAQAWHRVSRLIQDHNIIRQRELQCFCLKRSYRAGKLGVGVSVRRSRISSEFDLLSQEALNVMHIQSSVHNIPFRYWLPLPISWKHWKQVSSDLKPALTSIKGEIQGAENAPVVTVLYHFMSDIVVRLNEVADTYSGTKRGSYAQSSLTHASEKAIESYFHLFHILVCMACDDPSIVATANALLAGFAKGRRSKADCPNLAHLLVALLISDVQVTDELYKAIITEAITRNVVWLLDRKGANKAELSFLEVDQVSEYRLKHTFEGSLVSYRLLMFSELFRRTARPPAASQSLVQIRDDLFARHGAPPLGAAAHLAFEVRRLHLINTFPAFLAEMGLKHIPSAANFTTLLRRTVVDSMTPPSPKSSSTARGYSRWALSQREALRLRLYTEWKVGAVSRGHNEGVSADMLVLQRRMREWAENELLESGGDPKRTRQQLLARVPSFFPENERTMRRPSNENSRQSGATRPATMQQQWRGFDGARRQRGRRGGRDNGGVRGYDHRFRVE